MVEPGATLREDWDVIIVGTGVGGATLGYALAKAGKRVLFCERGHSYLSDPDALLGAYAETAFPEPRTPQPSNRSILARAGRYGDVIEDRSSNRSVHFIPFIGAGVGGSSALYGMAMERLHPSDFAPRANYPHAPGNSLPEYWPIGHGELAPHYTAAERLFGVRGARDPLRRDLAGEELPPGRDFSPPVADLAQTLVGKGLHPYRLPLACEQVAGCECCQGYLCGKHCKRDAARACLEPALRDYGAELLDDCEVTFLEASRTKVTGLRCFARGKHQHLSAPLVVLAAGALETPALLLRSVSNLWPEGVANSSGLVGKNLMRHFVDLYLLKPINPNGLDNRQKEIGFNDYYINAAGKFGSVQSFGRLPPVDILLAGMEQDVRDGPVPWLAPLFKLGKPFLRPALRQMSEHSLVLAGILEDLPYEDNCVTPLEAGGKSRLAIRYQIRPEATERIAQFRRTVLDALKPYSTRLIKQAENNQRIAHVCGTCRFGSDPATSVLDFANRAHDLDNLYVVDSSFFPSSGGTNPSLTIAANALRVAKHLLED